MVHRNTRCKTPELFTNYDSQNYKREKYGAGDLFLMEIHTKSEL